MGRFINADALVTTGQGLLGNNMFAYCLNNPVNRIDPIGACSHNRDCGRSDCPHSSNYFPYTASIGCMLGFGIGPLSMSLQIALVTDSAGVSEIQISYSAPNIFSSGLPAVDEMLDDIVSDSPKFKFGDTTISQILKNPVYTGTLINLKTEITNYKTKRKTPVPPERQIVIPNAHEAIIDAVQFEHVQEVRARNKCAANDHRFNLFRGKLFCECCGHPLAISKKQLKYREADIYLCMYHYAHPEACPKTHRVYHDMLYPYVLQQVQLFAKSMKRRKVNSKISEYATINELTPAVLDAVIDRIEIGHVKYKSKPGNVIRIFWKL